MKKLLCLCLVILLLAGCSNSSDEQQTPPDSEQSSSDGPVQKEIIIGRNYDATTLDVHEISGDDSYLIMNLMGEGLTRNDDGFVSPGAAESWDVSDDGTEYVFYIREDARWGDGQPLTAHDFAYSFLRMLDPDAAHYAADSAFIFKNGEKYFNGEASAEDVGVKVEDEYTLRVTLENPSLEALYTLARYPFFPVRQDVVEQHGVSYGSDASMVVTNGPYNLVEWSREDRLVLEKNEEYWNRDAISLSRIINKVGITEDTAVDMLLAGELDIYEFLSQDKFSPLSDAGFHTMSFVSGYQFAHMNAAGSSETARPFMENVNFRRAINYAVNREGITLSVYPGAEPATRLTAPTTPGVEGLFNEEYPYEAWPAAGDPEKARECLNLALDELGATLDDVPELSLLCYESQGSMLVMQAIQDMLLSTLGIQSSIDPQPIQQMQDKARRGEWDLWWGGRDMGALDWASTSAVALIYDSDDTTLNNSYQNPHYTELYRQLLVADTMQQRKDLLFEMEKELCENPGSVLVGWHTTWSVQNPRVTGALVCNDKMNYTYADVVS